MLRQTLQAGYSGGVVQDVPRHELPVGSVWKMTDFIPNQNGEPLQKRGPWKQAYNALTSAIQGVAWAPFAAGSALCAITSDGHLWTMRNSLGVITSTDMGASASVVITEQQKGVNTPGQSEVQVIYTYANGGTWTATFGGQTTTPIANGASASTVQTALQALSTISTGNVTVTLLSGNDGADTWCTYTVTFAGSLANAPQALIAVDGSGLTSLDVVPNWGSTEKKKGTAPVVHPEIQVITVTGNGGTYTLSFGGQTTGAIAPGATTATVQTALQGLSTVGAGNATVTGATGGPYTVTFAGTLTNAPQALITANSINLTNSGTGPAITTQRPIFFNDHLFFGQSVFDGTHGLQSMTGTFPNSSSAATSYKSRLVTSDGKTLYFSKVLDHTSWDSYSYVSATRPITGVAALRGMILIFSNGAAERLRGTTPPSSTSPGDFVLEPAFAEGCTDPGSIVVYREQVIWANETGVWMSDGASLTNLIEKGGLKQYWANLMASVYPSASLDSASGTLAAGVYDKYYVISVKPFQGAQQTLLCDLETGRWMFFSNLSVSMFAESQEATPQLFMAVTGLAYVGELSNCFTGAGTSFSYTDPNGVTIQPSLELPFFRPATGKTRFRDIFLGVNIDTSDGGGGQLLFDYVTTPDSASYASVTDDAGNPLSIGGTNGYELHRIPLHLSGNGLGLRIRQTGGSVKTALYEIEANLRVLEGRY